MSLEISINLYWHCHEQHPKFQNKVRFSNQLSVHLLSANEATMVRDNKSPFDKRPSSKEENNSDDDQQIDVSPKQPMTPEWMKIFGKTKKMKKTMTKTSANLPNSNGKTCSLIVKKRNLCKTRYNRANFKRFEPCDDYKYKEPNNGLSEYAFLTGADIVVRGYENGPYLGMQEYKFFP